MVIPAVEGPTGDAQLVERPLGGQVRLLDEPDDLELLGCGIPHSWSRPSVITLFSQQTVFERQVGNAFLQGTGFAAQILHFAAGRSTGGVASQAALARLHERLRPGVIQALGNAFLAAQLRDADLVLGREMPAGLPPDVPHHPIRRGLGCRFFQGGLGLHLRSFVTTTKPQPSLNNNLKSVPLGLTTDSYPDTQSASLSKAIRPSSFTAIV